MFSLRMSFMCIFSKKYWKMSRFVQNGSKVINLENVVVMCISYTNLKLPELVQFSLSR